MRVNQIAWNGGRGLDDLSECGTCRMLRLLDILDDELNGLDPVEPTLDETALKRLFFVADELRAKVHDLEDAFDRFRDESRPVRLVNAAESG